MAIHVNVDVDVLFMFYAMHVDVDVNVDVVFEGLTRIADITYICDCSISSPSFAIFESPTSTYHSLVVSRDICSSFNITCPIPISSCVFTDSHDPSQTVDFSQLSGHVMSAAKGEFLYSLYPCGDVPMGFCAHDGPTSIPTTTFPFLCQYDTIRDINRTLASRNTMSSTYIATNITVTSRSLQITYQTGQ